MRKLFRRKTLKIIGFQIVIAIVLLVLTDFLLWQFSPVDPEGTRKTIHQTLPGVRKTIIYERNVFGFRSLSMRQQEKPSNTIRIFCLGSSTTDQVTQSTEDTFYGILEKELNETFKDSKFRIEMVGYGRGGWKAIDTLAWVKTNLEAYDPDVVITLMGVNDLAWNGGSGYSLETFEERLGQREDEERKNGAVLLLEEYSQLYRRSVFARRRLKLWRHRNDGKVFGWHSRQLPKLREKYKQWPYVARPARNPDPIDEFSRAMNALLGLLQERRISVIVLGQAVLWNDSMSKEEVDSLWFGVGTPEGRVRASGSWLESEMHRYDRVQERLALHHGAIYVDLDTQIPKTLEYYFDDCHSTDLGSRKTASAIFPIVKELIEEMEGHRAFQ